MKDDVRQAGFVSRAMALAIDSALLGALHCGFFLGLGVVLGQAPAAHPSDLLATAIAYISIFLLTPLVTMPVYSTVLHACGGQTIGKLLMGIRVVTVNCEPLPAGGAFLRWVGTLVSALPLGAGFLWMLVDREQATWHDRLAGTMVVADEQTS